MKNTDARCDMYLHPYFYWVMALYKFSKFSSTTFFFN